jgi:osmoprotectant transport system substrate-binding protein
MFQSCKKALGIAAGLAVALTATACGGGSDAFGSGGKQGEGSSEVVTVGSANFPESVLLAEIYAAALENAGVETEKHLSIGAREIYVGAVQDGSIDLVPEYSGALLTFLDPENTDPSVNTSDEVYSALQEAMPEDLEVLEQSEAEDKGSLVVTQETAEKYDLESIADLAATDSELVIGAGPEFAERYWGLPGLKEVYGLQMENFRSLDSGGPLVKGALLDGSIDVANIFSTDSAIIEHDLAVLEDPENLSIAQNVVPLIRASQNSDTVTEALNAVSAALTTENLTEALARVQVDKENPAQVAEDFLAEQGLT